MLETIVVWVKSVIVGMGYPGLGLVMFLENVFPPIPSEIVLPLAGSLTLEGSYTIVGITLVGMLGSLLGAWVFYGIGRWANEDRLRGWVIKYGKWMLINESDLDNSFNWFKKYGDSAIFFGRMIPLVRSLISIPAGMAGMGPLKFTLFTMLGTALWNFILAMGGRLLGQGWELISDYVNRYQDAVVIILAALVLGFIIVRLYQNWRTSKTAKN